MRRLGGGRRWVACTAVCAFALVACGKARRDGTSAGNAGTDSGDGGANDHPTGVGGDAGTRPNAGSANGGVAGDADAGSAGELTLEPLPSQMRRLTSREYGFTVRDVLGTNTPTGMQPYATEVDGFDNNALANGVNPDLYQRYLETAEILANEVFASDALRAKVVTCAQADDVTCIRQVITQSGLRLFRRPLREPEIQGYQKAYARARARSLSHEGALKEVLTALLASAQFVYRMELVPAQPGNQPVGSYDLATRLSYLLWSSAPDPALLEAAANDQLTSGVQIQATVERLLDDPRSIRFSHSFGGQWLGAPRVALTPVDLSRFPQWTLSAAVAAGEELGLFFDDLWRRDLPWSSFLDSRAHFVNAELASVYGLTVSGSATQRVELDGVDRRGVLGLSGFLLQTSYNSTTHPTTRGRWITERLLCTTVPPPPPDSPGVDGPEGEAGVRPFLEKISSTAACADCHMQIDPLGLALENYDAIGRFRTSYSDGTPVDAKVILPASIVPPSGGPVSAMAGLSRALVQSPAFTACAAQKLYTYGFGRAFTDGERANVQALTQRWRSGPLTIKQLILRLTESPPFRERSDGGDR